MPRRCQLIVSNPRRPNGGGRFCRNVATRRRKHGEGPFSEWWLCAACDERVNPSYTPPVQAARAARGAMEWRRRAHRGGAAPGAIVCARDLANRRPLRLETIQQMKSYFEEHEADRMGYGFYKGEDAYPSVERVAWDLWGGDAGRAWAEEICRKRERKGEAK